MEKDRLDPENIFEDEDIEISEEDITNTIAYYKAKQAGLIEDIGMPESSYGVLGAMASDVMNAVGDYVNKKIDESELENSIDKAIIGGFATIITIAYETVSTAAKVFIKSKLPPVLHSVVDGAVSFVRETVIKGAVELVKKGWNLVKSFVKKLFA